MWRSGWERQLFLINVNIKDTLCFLHNYKQVIGYVYIYLYCVEVYLYIYFIYK